MYSGSALLCTSQHAHSQWPRILTRSEIHGLRHIVHFMVLSLPFTALVCLSARMKSRLTGCLPSGLTSARLVPYLILSGCAGFKKNNPQINSLTPPPLRVDTVATREPVMEKIFLRYFTRQVKVAAQHAGGQNPESKSMDLKRICRSLPWPTQRPQHAAAMSFAVGYMSSSHVTKTSLWHFTVKVRAGKFWTWI